MTLRQPSYVAPHHDTSSIEDKFNFCDSSGGQLGFIKEIVEIFFQTISKYFFETNMHFKILKTDIILDDSKKECF